MGKRGRPPHPDILTPREWQVLDLIRQDLTNEQIAHRLDISPATAKYHVSEILSRLGVENREQAAAWEPTRFTRSWWHRASAWVASRAWPLAGIATAAAIILAAIAGLTVLAAQDGKERAVAEPSPPETAPPSGTPVATSPATAVGGPPLLPAGSPQLAYIAPDGPLLVVTADGSDNRRLTDRCPGNQIEWSPDGEFLACNYFSIAIFDAAGRDIWRRDYPPEGSAARFLEWSPDSRRLAFRDADRAIHVLDIIGGTDLTVQPEAVPLGWIGNDSLLAGFNADPETSAAYDAYVLNVDQGVATRANYLDRNRFWLSPGGERAVVLSGSSGDGVGLAVYDLTTGVETPVPNAGLTYPSEAIPNRSIAFAVDPTRFFAASAQPGGPTTIFTCAIDASGCQALGSVPGLLLTISDEGLVAYLKPGGIPEMMTIVDLDAGTTANVGLAHPNFAWRPTQ